MGGGGGIGILEILIIAGLGFMFTECTNGGGTIQATVSGNATPASAAMRLRDGEIPISRHQANDGNFDENRFKDSVMTCSSRYRPHG
jgi:hypothetical protein